jgi:prepilin-type N-terminal cleavage/methylation domain-containing protein
MLRYVVLKHIFNKNYDRKLEDDRGFTLAEMLVTVIVGGILMAVTIPSFVGMMSQNQTQESADIIEAALKEVQKEAMAKSINCELNINSMTRKITASAFNVTIVGSIETISYVSGSAYNCLGTSYTLKSNTNLTTNGSPASEIKIRYSYKGNATSETVDTDGDSIPDPATIVITTTNNSNLEKKCVVVPDGVGIVQAGTYEGAANTAAPSNCKSDE